MKGLYTQESLGSSKEGESFLRKYTGSNMFNPKNSHQRSPDKIAADHRAPMAYEIQIENLSLVPPDQRPAIMQSLGKMTKGNK